VTTDVRHSTGSPRWGSPERVIEIARAVLTVPSLGVVQIYVDPFSDAEFNERVGAHIYHDGSPGRDGYRDRWLDDDASPRADHLLAGFRGAAPNSNRYTALVNPPNETPDLDAGEATKRAWIILERYHRLGWLGGGAVWIGFNLNQLQTLQIQSPGATAALGEVRSPLHADFMRCVPDRRLAFERHSSNVRAPTYLETKKIARRLGVSPMIVERWINVDPRGCPDNFRAVVAEETGDSPSHPMFFVLIPSPNEVVAAEQTALFESMACTLGEVW
jgi:hypothetical protein